MRAASLCVGLVLTGGCGRSVPEPVTPARAAAVTFPDDGGERLAGTLLIPARRGERVSAVLLLAGSGPTDRDGNQPPELRSDLLRTLAETLARHGVATLRYDKRGQYGSGAAPDGLPRLTDFCRWDHYVGDAVAAIGFLRGRPEVDAARVGLAGHSEGGLIALCAASDANPSVVMLLATPGRPVDVVLGEQLAASLRRQRLPPLVVAYILSQNARTVRSLRTTGRLPADGVSVWLTPLYQPYLDEFWHGELAVDPPALAAAFPGPVLVVNGTVDGQVSADRDGGALDAALGRRSPDSHRWLRVPGCGHNLKPVRSPADDGVLGDVPADTLDAIARWAADHL